MTRLLIYITAALLVMLTAVISKRLSHESMKRDAEKRFKKLEEFSEKMTLNPEINHPDRKTYSSSVGYPISGSYFTSASFNE